MSQPGPRTIQWRDLGSAPADADEGASVAIEGFAVAAGVAPARRFVLLAEPSCCPGCVPRDARAVVEVFAATPVRPDGQRLRLTGTWRVSAGQDGWRYQLHDARPARPPGWSTVTRRGALAAGPLMCLAAGTPARAGPRETEATRIIGATQAIDMHSHAGGVASASRIRTGGAFGPVAPAMRQGGLAAMSLAIVSDGPVHKVGTDGRIHPYRDPLPGELYEHGTRALRRVNEMARDQGIAIIRDGAGLRAANAGRPSMIVAAEGADFLEGQIDRVSEAHANWSLRHLQLTHYRVNELGDIQTEAPVHGGLTPFGEAVIRRCNQLGIVVDVAHGTFDLVKRAAAVTTRPLVLSHTSLSARPVPFSRQISLEHARLVAGTGGVIGIWPPAAIFGSMAALAAGIARTADAAGIDHVGIGTDLRGLVGASVVPGYEHWPELADALLEAGFGPADAAKILGGNYARVCLATMP